MKTLAVVVLGDLGHSPRMNYHISSLMQLDKENKQWNVEFIGYLPSKLSDVLAARYERVRIRGIPLLPSVFRFQKSNTSVVLKLALMPIAFAYAALKLMLQTVYLIYILLLLIDKPKVILVQIPPSLPILCILHILKATFFHNVLWMIDWHNTGSSIIALQSGNNLVGKAVVAVSEWAENVFVQKADIHICVSRAMSKFVKTQLAKVNKDKEILVLYDKAQEDFRRLNGDVRRVFLYEHLSKTYKIRIPSDKQDNFWIVTSTSWTKDENFDILINSLIEMDKSNDFGDRNIIVVITGKGPMREHYMAIFHDLSAQWKNRISVHSIWLTLADYPQLLGSCDLGLSFHVSSSGLDLPMKVVDMFGCGLPCLALKFQCINELVVDGVNGFTFENERELSKLLARLINSSSDLAKLEKGLEIWSKENHSFHTHWNNVLYPFFNQYD